MCMATDAYVAPRVRDADVTTDFVRDELLRCFESANREFFEILGQPATEAQVREQVHGFATSSKMAAPFSACSAVVTSGGRSRRTLPKWPAFQTSSPRRKHSNWNAATPSFHGSFVRGSVTNSTPNMRPRP